MTSPNLDPLNCALRNEKEVQRWECLLPHTEITMSVLNGDTTPHTTNNFTLYDSLLTD